MIQTEDAKQLYELIHGINCHVNLIPVNPVKERILCAVGTKSDCGVSKINLKIAE